MFRVFVGGVHMEANSFNPVYATWDTFTTKLEGSRMEEMRGTSLELGGVYDCFDAVENVEVVPGFFAQALTSGPVKGEDFARLSDRLFIALESAGKVDGVLLVLHGAMQSEHIDDCEGYIIRRVRELVGETTPVCASLDFHALVTREMVSHIDGASGYFTYPHVDHFETGKRAAQALLRLMRTKTRVSKICMRIPLIMSCENSNTIDSPMVPAMESLKALLKEEGVLCGSLFLTQPWLDTKEHGCSILIFTEDEGKRAHIERCMKDILRYIWDSRERFYPPMPDIREALSRISSMKPPVLLVDYGDVPNAGGTGDGTIVLKALIEAKLDQSSVVIVADEKSAVVAARAGVGSEITLEVGGFGKTGDFNGRIHVTGTVLNINPEPFVHLGPAQKGFVSRPGLRVLIRTGNVYIILCKKVCFSHDRNMLLSMGLEPSAMGVIAMRATHSFMSCYADEMGSWLYVDTPGYSTRNLKSLPFARCERPIYPLDELNKLIIKEVI